MYLFINERKNVKLFFYKEPLKINKLYDLLIKGTI